MKYFVGQKVRIGGILGCIMTITEIHGDDLVLKDDCSLFFYHKGDCVLIPVKEASYEQLTLF